MLRHKANVPPSEVTITGTGAYVPERVVTNAELSMLLGENIDDFVSNMLGIKERRYCAANESTADLAEAAPWIVEDALRVPSAGPRKARHEPPDELPDRAGRHAAVRL